MSIKASFIAQFLVRKIIDHATGELRPVDLSIRLFLKLLRIVILTIELALGDANGVILEMLHSSVESVPWVMLIHRKRSDKGN